MRSCSRTIASAVPRSTDANVVTRSETKRLPVQRLSPTEGKTTLRLWPHRSLPRRGMAAFIAITAVLVTLPLLALLGSALLWGVLPFFVLAIAGVWWGLERSYRDGEILEELTLTETEITLTRTGPRRARQHWRANPHWVRAVLHQTGGPVPDYLTLQGGPREVELGAFLTPEERRALFGEVTAALAALR